MRISPGKLVQNTAEVMGINVTHGGRPRSLGLEWKFQQEIPNIAGNVPYLVWQYDGGAYAIAFSGLKETERSVGYTLWHNDIYKVEELEHKFFEALLRTKRVVGASQVFSFVDNSTARSIGTGAGGLHGIQREVLIRR